MTALLLVAWIAFVPTTVYGGVKFSEMVADVLFESNVYNRGPAPPSGGNGAFSYT